ncbi:HDOD domain-containing protein [Undibacterium squillarum]|uniref:HDOD domain-containing protein n=1 Tax=Undibacterium squillarum TaxID=1131567 RepID=UPI0035B13ECE
MKPVTEDFVLRKMHELPSLPKALTDVIHAIDRDNTDQRSLIMKLAQDQAVTTKTLRIANSSFYGLSYHVHSLSDAVSILGFRSLRALVMATVVTNQIHHFDVDEHALEELLNHSIQVAVYAQLLASHVHFLPEEAFTAGLIHDFGKLILLSEFPVAYAQVRALQAAQKISLCEAEVCVLGMDHAQVGRLLAAHWHFPPEMQQAVGEHHLPVTPQTHLLSVLIQAANFLVRDEGSLPEKILQLRRDEMIWTILNLDDALLEDMQQKADAGFREIQNIWVQP